MLTPCIDHRMADNVVALLTVSEVEQEMVHKVYLNVEYPVTVPAHTVFVMGDNRNNSNDSRGKEVGFIDEKDIVGKVLFRIFPFQSIGLIK